MNGEGEFFEEGFRGNGNPAMQTLGAKNDFVRNNRQRSTLDTKRPSKGPAPNPPQAGTGAQYGIHNSSYKNDSDEEQQMAMSMGNTTAARNAINLSMYGQTPKSGTNTRRARDLNNSEV